MQYNLSNKDEATALHFELARLMISKPTVEFGVPTKSRTVRQNSALHKFYELLADELNLAGLDMKKTLNPAADIPWTADNVKQFLWKPVQKAQLQKESTTSLTTKEIDVVYATLMRHLGEKFGVSLEFPSNEREGA